MAKAKRKYAHLLVGEAKVCKVLGSAENRIKVTLKHWVVGLIPSARIGLILFVSDASLQRRLLNDHDHCGIERATAPTEAMQRPSQLEVANRQDNQLTRHQLRLDR